MGQKFKEFVKIFLLLLLGCVLAFVVMEVILRVYNPFLFRVRGDKITLPTNQEYVIHNTNSEKLDPVVVHTKNALGFRGENPPDNFEDYLSIVTIGGSTTEAFYLSDDKTWTHLLGVRLENSFERVWINNAGLDGHSTFGHLILMEDYIVQLKPKIVLLLVGSNDVGRADYSAFEMANIKDGIYFHSVKEFFKSTANYSEVFALILNIQRYIRAWNVAHQEIDLRVLETTNNASKETEAQIRRLHTETFLKSYEQRLEKLIKIARASGIEPILVTQTALYGPGIDDVTNVDLARIKFGQVDGEFRWEVMELYNDVTRQVGNREAVFVVDLAGGMPRSSRYYYDFIHYTNEGSEKVAEVIYAQLCPHLAEEYSEYVTNDCETVTTRRQ